MGARNQTEDLTGMSRQLEIQTNHKHLTPEGLPSHHVYDENKKNVAAFVKLEDAVLFVTASMAEEEESQISQNAADGPTGDGGLGRTKPHYASAATLSPHGADGLKPKGQALA